MKGKERFLNVVFSVLFVLIGVGIGMNLRGDFPVLQTPEPTVEFLHTDKNIHQLVYSILKQEYVDSEAVDDQEMYYGLIKGMVASVGDPATVYMDPEEYAEYKKDLGGEYEGIGALLEQQGPNIIVVSVFEGAPAERAGLKAGDIIIKVDGEQVTGMPILEVVRKIRGPKGTKVTLTVYRENGTGELLDIEITRSTIDAPSMRLTLEDNIAILRISRFSDDTVQDWLVELAGYMDKLRTMLSSGQAKGLIIDLRGNPGGYLEGAIEFVSYFEKPGKPVTYKKGRNGIDGVFNTRDVGYIVPPDIPIVILIDGGSASASEIVAGALQFYQRAYLIGEPTFGKATVQDSQEFDDGSYLKYTIAYWTLPNKQSITKENPVKPDLEVKYDSVLKKEQGVDNQLKAAKEYINKIIAE